MSTQLQALVVGGGISGLVCAHALRKAGVDAQLVEASARPGGVIRTEKRDGYLLELGPQSFSGTDAILALCRELGIEKNLVAAPANAPRYVLAGGKLQPVPLSPPAFLASPLFSMGTKASLMRDAFAHTVPPLDDESIADFVRRKFSAELLDKLVGPFVSGIYAGDPERLSLRAAFPQVYEAENAHGSVIRGMKKAAKAKGLASRHPTLNSFRDGNETLVQALAASLGANIRCHAKVIAITNEHGEAGPNGHRFVTEVHTEDATETIMADYLVLAAPTGVTGSLLSDISPEYLGALSAIEYAKMAVISLGYKKLSVRNSLEGFGFLVPRSEGPRILGAVWNSSLFPNRAPADNVLLTSFIGGATDPEAIKLSKEELVATVHREISPPLGITDQPSFSNVEIYERAIPQYNLGHTARLEFVTKSNATRPNLKLIGNYLHGPAIGACVDQALQSAAEIASSVSRK